MMCVGSFSKAQAGSHPRMLGAAGLWNGPGGGGDSRSFGHWRTPELPEAHSWKTLSAGHWEDHKSLFSTCEKRRMQSAETQPSPGEHPGATHKPNCLCLYQEISFCLDRTVIYLLSAPWGILSRCCWGEFMVHLCAVLQQPWTWNVQNQTGKKKYWNVNFYVIKGKNWPSLGIWTSCPLWKMSFFPWSLARPSLQAEKREQNLASASKNKQSFQPNSWAIGLII
jgi:hypothetical protein